MATINLETVERDSTIYSIIICRRAKSAGQIRREIDLDNTFNGDEASSLVYHRTNGIVINLRGWLREEYFEEDLGESQISDNTVILVIPSHRFYFKIGNTDWIEIEGQRYRVLLSKKRMGGTTTLLLHIM